MPFDHGTRIDNFYGLVLNSEFSSKDGFSTGNIYVKDGRIVVSRIEDLEFKMYIESLTSLEDRYILKGSNGLHQGAINVIIHIPKNVNVSGLLLIRSDYLSIDFNLNQPKLHIDENRRKSPRQWLNEVVQIISRYG